MPWFVYIIECSDGKFYTGISNNVERRVKAHNNGSGGRFTKYRRPVELLYTEEYSTKPEALSREQWVRLSASEE